MDIRTALKIKTAPSAEPILSAEAKLWLKLDSDTTDDTIVASLIKAARIYCEAITGRALITQTWYYYLDSFPYENFIKLPKPPLQSVTSIKYTDSNGTLTTMSASDYSVDTDSFVGRIVLNYGKSWPVATLATKNPIVIEYICGYGAAGTNVPDDILTGIKVDIADMYQNRQSDISIQNYQHLDTVDRLYSNYQIWDFI